MSKTFKNLNDLLKHIKKDVSKSLKNSVAPKVKDEMSSTIKERTYKEYTPTLYERTGELADTKNMSVEVVDDNTIIVTNERSDGNKDVARIVSTGLGYTWQQSQIYKMQPFPRNFYEQTVEALKKNKEHVKALKSGLESMGYKVK